jgi:solute carrier family 13 (sodium-dependent dicarboxylate transporter), member 2/3/5
MTKPETDSPLLSRTAAIGLLAGLAIFATALVLPPPAGLPVAGWHTLGLALFMAVWWTTEPVPIGVTALLPLIVLPLLGVADIAAAAAPYANPLVFLFLGGFLLAACVKRWGLHRRIAYGVVVRVGTDPRRLILGFMLASGFLSMWISNTAAVILLLPVAMSVIAAVENAIGTNGQTRRFALALLLGLAYAASIGGVGTLIGTPPNALLAGYLGERHGIDLSFAAWSAMAVPLAAIFLPLAWLLLTRVVFPIGRDMIEALGSGDLLVGIGSQGPMTAAEKRVGIVFLAAAFLWMTRPLLNQLPGLAGLTDPGIALTCAAALFLIPSGDRKERRFLMTWREAQDIPWQVLILFGGGLSLAAAMDSSGLAQWIGDALAGLGGLSPFVFLVIVTATVVALTELSSNTATTAALLPVVATLAAGADMDILTISAAVAIAASCAFMLPVATPPNAIVFAAGYVTVADMVRAGFLMNLLSVALVSSAVWLLAPLLIAAH